MSRRSRTHCKFFAKGICLKGEHCQFSHDWREESNNVCRFYQKGACAYGSRCKYKHINASCPRPRTSSSSSNSSLHSDVPQATQPSSPSPPNPRSHSVPYCSVSYSTRTNCPSSSSPSNTASEVLSSSPQVTHPSSSLSNLRPPVLTGSTQETQLSNGNLKHREQSSLSKLSPSKKSVWVQKSDARTLSNCMNGNTLSNSMNVISPARNSLADQPICSFAAGSCPNGENCGLIHADLCSICEKHCLHPYRPEEREEHAKMCLENNKRREALRLSQEIECSVCFDRVLSKPSPDERKFGLLPECDHPFCISCIRKWRSSSPASGMDVDSALRACPICRKPSYFVVPSTVWYSSQEDKQEIVTSYKNRLSCIDCKYFNFGCGSCPFGSRCFYRHTYNPRKSRPQRHSYRPPRRNRRTVVDEEAILGELFQELALGAYYDDDVESLDYDDFTDPFRHMAEEDPEGFMEYALFAALMNEMQNHVSSDDEYETYDEAEDADDNEDEEDEEDEDDN